MSYNLEMAKAISLINKVSEVMLENEYSQEEVLAFELRLYEKNFGELMFATRHLGDNVLFRKVVSRGELEGREGAERRIFHEGRKGEHGGELIVIWDKAPSYDDVDQDGIMKCLTNGEAVGYWSKVSGSGVPFFDVEVGCVLEVFK